MKFNEILSMLLVKFVGNGGYQFRRQRKTGFILTGQLAVLLLFSGSLSAQYGYCPAPGTPKYESWVNEQAGSGNYRVYTPSQRQQGYNVSLNVGNGSLGASAGYSNQTTRQSWSGSKNPPHPGQPFYINDRRSGLRTAPQTYQRR